MGIRATPLPARASPLSSRNLQPGRGALTVACVDEGGHPEFLERTISSWAQGVRQDTAKVLGRMFDGIQFRGFKQSVVEDLPFIQASRSWNGH